MRSSRSPDDETLIARLLKDRFALLEALRAAPPREAVDDQRYWTWRARVDALLLKLSD